MTTTKPPIDPLIGQVGLYPVQIRAGKGEAPTVLRFPVRITHAVSQYGNQRVTITPVDGSGTHTTNLSKLTMKP